MKKLRVLVIVLMVALAFCACGDQSKGEDAGMVTEFVQQWFRGNYEDAAAYICSDIASSLGAEELETIAADTIGTYGAFSEINGVSESNVSYYLDSMGVDLESAATNLDDYDIYYGSLVFEQDDIGLFILVDNEEHLVYGMTVCGSESNGGYHSHGGTIHKH